MIDRVDMFSSSMHWRDTSHPPLLLHWVTQQLKMLLWCCDECSSKKVGDQSMPPAANKNPAVML